MRLMPLIIELISGAVGGNIAGGLLKQAHDERHGAVSRCADPAAARARCAQRR